MTISRIADDANRCRSLDLVLKPNAFEFPSSLRTDNYDLCFRCARTSIRSNAIAYPSGDIQLAIVGIMAMPDVIRSAVSIACVGIFLVTIELSNHFCSMTSQPKQAVNVTDPLFGGERAEVLRWESHW